MLRLISELFICSKNNDQNGFIISIPGFLSLVRLAYIPLFQSKCVYSHGMGFKYAIVAPTPYNINTLFPSDMREADASLFQRLKFAVIFRFFNLNYFSSGWKSRKKFKLELPCFEKSQKVNLPILNIKGGR